MTNTESQPAGRRGLSLPSATGLVVGSVVGTGVFTMPAVVAKAGTVGVAVVAVVSLGALVLAVLFGQLTARIPDSDGGLYAYARHEFGDFAGYLVGWSYWISAWAGNAAIVASWVFYVEAMLGLKSPTGLLSWGIAMIGLWVPALVNLAGVHQMAWFQNITVVLKFVPLMFIALVGWFFVDTSRFHVWNTSGGSVWTAIGLASGVALFSFIGVEAAAVTAKRVSDPGRNVGRASVLGVAACALLYVLVTAAVVGLVPHDVLIDTGSPFVNAFEAIFDQHAWAGTVIAAVAVVSGIGALNGWTLIVTESSRVMAQNGLFPASFGWTDRNGTAWFGIVVGAVLPSVLMLWRYTSTSGLTVFTYLVNLTVVTVAIPYFISALAQLSHVLAGRRMPGVRLVRDLLIASAVAAFSMWVTFAAGYQLVYQALVVIMAGLIGYAVLSATRGDQRNGLVDPAGPAVSGRRRAVLVEVRRS
jgi:APA family basic amino acid/polyamine antiporter